MITKNKYFTNMSMDKRRQWFGIIIAHPALFTVFSTIFYPLFVGIFNSFLDIKLMNLNIILVNKIWLESFNV